MIALCCVASFLLGTSPAVPHAPIHLLDEQLSRPRLAIVGERSMSVVDLSPLPSPGRGRLAASTSEGQPSSQGGEAGEQKEKPGRPKAAPESPGALDFDLLGTPAKPQQIDERALRLRRTLLGWHQGVGLGMFALQLATTVVGQLNYDDKFGGDNTAKYVQPHAVLAFSTLAAFAAAGTLAILAPAPLKRDEGFDRVSLHKLSMFTAALGMAAQAGLGIWAQSREGYLNQQGIARAHLVVGYVTLAAVATGVSALVF